MESISADSKNRPGLYGDNGQENGNSLLFIDHSRHRLVAACTGVGRNMLQGFQDQGFEPYTLNPKP